MTSPGPDIVTGSDGQQKYRLHVELQWAYPFDPNSPLMLLWAPPGGIGEANLPFILKGDNGFSPTIASAERTLLEPGDPTADSYSMVELSPATDDHGQIVKLVAVEHKGAKGDDGVMVLDPDDYGTKVAGRLLGLKSDLTGFEYTPPTIVGSHWPATAPTAAPSGTTGAFDTTSIVIPANTYPFPTRVEVSAGTTVTASGTGDVKVDLVARLNATGGPILGYCNGIGGLTDRLALIDGPDPGTDPADVTIAANAAATIYIRTERQAGGVDNYQTSVASTRACAKVFRVG
ncbi:putative Gp20 [uncultured Mycobacterium sp.]|uniref:Putative Gp20 n=1 Tax=uncultured Mycobacterium sp. TaxID=171292 RepID=A0A1Y5P541_9MYCO|nr:putative Gp20 [uncultured Mycobacterium sp.]